MDLLWIISAMDCKVQEDNLENVVTTVHWRLKGSQESNGKLYTAERYGATTMGQPSPESFTPFDQLTEEQVVGWLEATLDVEQMTAQLQADINLQITPVTVTLTPAWIPTPGQPATSAPAEEASAN
jgi:hypothetical protein